MMRDITMIVSVLISIVAVLFGVYERLDANNTKSFAYEQAYRMMGVIQNAPISDDVRTTLVHSALGQLSAPPSIISVSGSKADEADIQVSACTKPQRTLCTRLASQLATANTVCARSQDTAEVCATIPSMQDSIAAQGCFGCFTR